MVKRFVLLAVIIFFVVGFGNAQGANLMGDLTHTDFLYSSENMQLLKQQILQEVGSRKLYNEVVISYNDVSFISVSNEKDYTVTSHVYSFGLRKWDAPHDYEVQEYNLSNVWYPSESDWAIISVVVQQADQYMFLSGYKKEDARISMVTFDTKDVYVFYGIAGVGTIVYRADVKGNFLDFYIESMPKVRLCYEPNLDDNKNIR